MRVLCVGGGPAGLYFALLMKKADPRHAIRVVERNRPYDTFGWGVVFSDQTLGNLASGRPATAPRDPRRVQPLGRHRRPLPRHDDHVRRPRLLRHRPQAPAQHPAGALRGARRRARVRDRRHRRHRRGARIRRRPRHRRDGINSRDPHALRRRLHARHRRAALPLRLARHEEAVRRLHVRLRGDRARLVPGARLPVRRRHVDLHRRDARGGLAEGRPRPHDAGGRRSRSASSCSRRGSTASGCCPTPRTCAARRSGSSSRASSAGPGCTGPTSTAAACRSC